MIEFRPITGFPGYEVSSDGRVWSYLVSRPKRGPNGRIIKGRWCRGNVRRELHPGENTNGYYEVSLRRCGKSHQCRVHQLICGAFHGPRPGSGAKWHAAHRDGNQKNNAPSNLRWATPSDNERDKTLYGVRRSHVR